MFVNGQPSVATFRKKSSGIKTCRVGTCWLFNNCYITNILDAREDNTVCENVINDLQANLS